MSSIEKIKDEIKRLYKEHSGKYGCDEAAITLEHLEDFIDSLPEEPGVDVTDFCKPIDPGIAQCIADHWWEMLGDKEPDKSQEEAAITYSKQVSDGHNYRDLRDGFIAGDKWGAEQFAKIVRANLPEIGKDAQSQFEQLYFEITGNKMYGGYND